MLVGSVYFCRDNDYCEENWGQIQYGSLLPAYRETGIGHRLLSEALMRAERWRLSGVIFCTDRKLLVDGLMRAKAIRWKTEKKDADSRIKKFCLHVKNAIR